MAKPKTNKAEALATVLRILHGLYGAKRTLVSTIYSLVRTDTEQARALAEALGDVTGKPVESLSLKAISWRLKAIQNMLIEVGEALLMLRYEPDKYAGATVSVVDARKQAA